MGRHSRRSCITGSVRHSAGLTLIELMISITISLVVLVAMLMLLRNSNRNNDEMARVSDLTDVGRTSLQILSDDLSHAGYWGGYIPSYDDLTFSGTPVADVPTAIPDPCKDPATWTTQDINNLIGIPLVVSSSMPGSCAWALGSRANSDFIVVRHAELCVPGAAGCDALTTGLYYLQVGHCQRQLSNTALAAGTNSLTLSTTDPIATASLPRYVGAMIRIPGGGAGATVGRLTGISNTNSSEFTTDLTLSGTPQYSIPLILGSSTTPALLQRDCVTPAEVRRFVSNVYYVADVNRNGTTVPALVRSELAMSGTSLTQLAPEPLIYGVEAIRVVLGLDTTGKNNAVPNYSAAVTWQDPTKLVTPTNRGDGIPDQFVQCSSCSVAQLTNVVAAKIYMLVRATEATPGYSNTKSYCLGEPAGTGSCPTASKVTPAADGFSRHVFTSSIRLTNVAGRRETP